MQSKTPDLYVYVVIARDYEADIWHAGEASIPGLAASAPELDELYRQLALLIPDLLGDQMPQHVRLRCIDDSRDADVKSIDIHAVP